MDKARSLYKGGKIIKATDENLTYLSYKDLGLRCCYCGEEVHLRKGLKRTPYFAHFKQTTLSQECDLRILSYDELKNQQLNNLYDDHGQRRKIFQQHFLNIITKRYSDFDLVIKNQDNTLAINLFKDKMWEIFEKDFYNRCLSALNNFRNKKLIAKNSLKDKIIIEAIDYLSLENNNYILKEIVYYIVKKSLNQKEYLIKPNIFLDGIQNRIINFLNNVDWLKYFDELEAYPSNENRIISLTAKNTKSKPSIKNKSINPLGNQLNKPRLNSSRVHTDFREIEFVFELRNNQIWYVPYFKRDIPYVCLGKIVKNNEGGLHIQFNNVDFSMEEIVIF